VSGQWSTLEIAGQAGAAACGAGFSVASCTGSSLGAGGGGGNCNLILNGSVEGAVILAQSTVACAASCAALPRLSALVALSGNVGGTGGLYCVNSCGYTNDANTLAIGGASGGVIGGATPTGLSCSGGVSGAVASMTGNCTQSASSTLCVSTDGSKASVGPDLIDFATAGAPGSCKGYSDGAAACVVSMLKPPAAPPEPSAVGSPGVPATPDVLVVQGDGGTGTNPNQIQYFGQVTVAGSPTKIVTTNSTIGSSTAGVATGAGAGIGGAGSGASGTGTGSCPVGQTCGTSPDSISGGLDCTAPPVCLDTDPVLCGVSNQVWLDRCALTDAADVATAVAFSGEAVTSSSADQSAVLSETGPITGNSGTCPEPISVTWMNRTISLDLFSFLCQFAVQISFAVLATAYIVGAKIWLGALVS
jgi:hypothetical protein